MSFPDAVVFDCVPLSKTVDGCTYRSSSLVIRLNQEHPTIAHTLDALHDIPRYRLDVLDVVVEHDFNPASVDLLKAVVAETWSIYNTRSLFTSLSRTLRSFTLLRSSCDPFHPSLDGRRMLEGISFPSLIYFAIHGDNTSTNFSLPLSPSFAPHLQHLQLPSNMLSDDLSRYVPAVFPSLVCFTLHPLRSHYTVAQLDALIGIAQFLGVSMAHVVHQPPTVGQHTPTGTTAATTAVNVTVYMEHSSDRRRSELERFKNALGERLVGGTRGVLAIHVEGVEPSLAEVTRVLEGQLSR